MYPEELTVKTGGFFVRRGQSRWTWLDERGLSLEDFCHRMPASWLLDDYRQGGKTDFLRHVPTKINYFLMRSLGLTNSSWVYVLPGLVSAFNLIVIRTYISGLSDSLIESAKIDGAGEFTIFTRIILPLGKPVLATIALFIVVDNWNAWFDTFLYSANPQLSALQYELMKVLQSANTVSGSLLQALSRAAAFGLP